MGNGRKIAAVLVLTGIFALFSLAVSALPSAAEGQAFSVSGTADFVPPAVGDPSSRVPSFTFETEGVSVDVCRWDRLLETGYTERYAEKEIRAGRYLLYVELLVRDTALPEGGCTVAINGSEWNVLDSTQDGPDIRIRLISAGVTATGESSEDKDSNGSLSVLVTVLFCVMIAAVVGAVVVTVVILRKKPRESR